MVSISHAKLARRRMYVYLPAESLLSG
jgi:hypothetical protein